jgi:hypothetical protein
LTPPVKAVHRPLGSAALAGWRLCNQVGGVAILHAWSPAGLRAGQAVRERSPARAPRLLLSIPCAPASSRALERLVQDIRQGCFHLTVPTHAARQSMIAAGAPAEAVHVLPPPAPPIDQLQRRRARVRAELGLSDSEQLIVAPSEMTRYAGHKYASWAHAILRQVLPVVHDDHRVVNGPAAQVVDGRNLERVVRDQLVHGRTDWCGRVGLVGLVLGELVGPARAPVQAPHDEIEIVDDGLGPRGHLVAHIARQEARTLLEVRARH